MKLVHLHAYLYRQINELGQMAREFGHAYGEMAVRSSHPDLHRLLLKLNAAASEHLRHLGQAGLAEIPVPHNNEVRTFNGLPDRGRNGEPAVSGEWTLMDVASSALCLLHFQLAFLEATHAIASQLSREQAARHLLAWLDDMVESIADLSGFMRDELSAAQSHGLEFDDEALRLPDGDSAGILNWNGTWQMPCAREFP